MSIVIYSTFCRVQESTTTSTIPPLGVRLSEIQTTVATTTKPKSLCGRFQFQCLESKECIAIYNACDGIPQCSDASDESKTEVRTMKSHDIIKVN